ncbi:hypothetical protein L3X38_010541 [Prunus dulcis]|uniref:Uncharacterized protein n=1 Tax=Prunus dulcis TaxID=3755 RepID=A0AAD4WFM2_PRUDU|nr:hypothetical protein L3X38_010541 [Prunus dulcis]
MAGMAAGMLAAAKMRKQGGLMVAEVKVGTGKWLFPMGKMECLKNISFAHPHWRTPSNRLGLWCSKVASPKSPLSKSFRGPCEPL